MSHSLQLCMSSLYMEEQKLPAAIIWNDMFKSYVFPEMERNYCLQHCINFSLEENVQHLITIGI